MYSGLALHTTVLTIEGVVPCPASPAFTNQYEHRNRFCQGQRLHSFCSAVLTMAVWVQRHYLTKPRPLCEQTMAHLRFPVPYLVPFRPCSKALRTLCPFSPAASFKLALIMAATGIVFECIMDLLFNYLSFTMSFGASQLSSVMIVLGVSGLLVQVRTTQANAML